jgi:hypothetical protein
MTHNILESKERFIAWAGPLVFQAVKHCREADDLHAHEFCDGIAGLMYQSLTDTRSTNEISESNKKLSSEISDKLRTDNKLQ